MVISPAKSGYTIYGIRSILHHKMKKEPRNRIPRFFGFDQKMILCLAVAAQNIDQLVGNHVLDSLTSRLQVLARVEVIRMLSEVLADRSGDSQTNIGVDIDLADGQLCSVTQLFLRNADCIRHLAAELVDLVNKLTRYGRGTVQYDREARQTLGNFLEYVETQRRRNQNAVSLSLIHI